MANAGQEQPKKNQLESGAFSEQEREGIRNAIHEKYKKVARTAEGLFKYPTGREGAQQLGYPQDILRDISDELIASFCGVGNPLAIAPVAEGEAVLDIGCGTGFDLLVASRTVGENGRVCGVDITPEMIAAAKKSCDELNLSNVEIHAIDSSSLPFPENSFDVVISNGVINLSPQKPELFREIFRVLKAGGRLQFADIMLSKPLPPEMMSNLDAWAQ